MRMRIRLVVLASGSSGNAAVVEGPKGSILVDCGLSRRELHRRADAIGCDLGRICAILVTHEHSDHTKGLPVVSKHFDGDIFATEGTMAARAALTAIPFTPLSPGSTLTLAGMRIQTFALSHDVTDPVCFRFDLMDGTRTCDSVGWATDTGVLTDEAIRVLHGCRILGIEANHDRHMLQTGPYPYYLQARVGGEHGHLSNTQAATAIASLVGMKTETVVAMHISQKNNTPKLVRQALGTALDQLPKQKRPTLVIASQDEPLAL